VTAVARIAMGQSRAMYRVRVDVDAGAGVPPVSRGVVVRVEQWGLLGTDSSDEVRVMQALHEAGYPVARVLAYERSPELLGQPFFVMEEAPGTSVQAPETLEGYVRTLTRLHGLDWRSVGLDFLPAPADSRDSARLQVERWYGVYRWGIVGEPSPLLEEAAEWLRIHAPETRAVQVVHGDPGPGNYLHQDGLVTAVVDWEFTHLGDADEDWAYLIAMRGASMMPEVEWVTYLARFGVELEPDRLRYWKAVNFFKGACIDQTALKLYIDGTNPAPNMLAIGTGVHLSALKRLADTVLR
jgi:aminoglycoside phosphotransferase (APT) family kinase protein